MPLRDEQIQEAEQAQHTAAHDESEHVRVVAGPGTGKSATIEERVCWLLERSVAPEGIMAVSFTRAAARDLERRIEAARAKRGLDGGESVAASTLHALALRMLRSAGALTAYPVDPVVLQQWELRNIFKAEFAQTVGIGGLTRPAQIRRDHEAFWSTGQFDPPASFRPIPRSRATSANSSIASTVRVPSSTHVSFPAKWLRVALSVWIRARSIPSSC